MLQKVLLGEFDFSQSTDCDKINDYCSDPPREIGIAKVILHEDYRPRVQGNSHDIAIIKMTEFIEFSNFIADSSIINLMLFFILLNHCKFLWEFCLE